MDVGILTLIGDLIRPGDGVVLLAENGVLGVGGAMDLASGARRPIIAMSHTNRDGSAKIVAARTLPLTARGAVTTVITERDYRA